MIDDDENPTLGAYVPVPPGGGGGDDDLDVEVPSAPSTRAPERASPPSQATRPTKAAGPDASAAAATSGDGFPPTVALPVEPGMTFVSTTGDPDTYQPPATATRGEDDEPTRISERFEVVQLLGKGGMGRVYRVRDRHIQGRELALKILHRRYSESPYFKELFFREIKTAQEFVSEHVNQVRDTGITDDGQLFLTMDLVDGETLRSLLRREQTLGVRHALEISRQTLIGLQSGHEQGFIHRDVKPENVMLAAKVPKTDANPFGVGVRLLDFGLAGLAAELEEGGTHGTPMYMSPEQAQGKRLDPRSDLFAVGTVLYEMLVGSRPFHGKTVANVLTSVIETDVHPLIDQIEHVDKRVRKLLRKALAKKREDRFQSAAEFIAAIEKAPAFRPPTEVPLWATAAIVVLAAGTLAGGGLWWSRDGEVKSLRAALETANGNLGSAAALNARLQADLDMKNAEKTEQVATKVDVVDNSSQVRDLELRFEAQQKETDRIREQQQRDKEASDKQIADLEKTTREQAAQLKELEKIKRQTLPVPLAARAIDTMIRLVGDGYLRGAAATVTALSMREVFETDPLQGKDYLLALGDLCGAIDDFAATGDDALRQKFLADAEAALKRVGAARPRFAIEAADYLNEVDDDGNVPERLAQLDKVAADLGARVSDMRASAAAGAESAWDAYLAAGADQDPAPVCDLAAQTGAWENVRTILEAYAKRLELQATRSGELDVDVLRADPWLATWAERIERTPQLRDERRAKDLRLMAFARAWHSGENPRRLTTAELDLPSAPLTSPRADWRWSTHLAALLTSDRSAWPLGPTKVAIYLKTSPTGNQWIKDAGKGKEDASWVVTRSIYKERGDKVDHLDTSDFAYDLHDGRIFGWDGGSIDVMSDPAKVGRFEAAFSGEVPTKLGVTGDEIAAFRARLASADASERACLVYVDGKTTRWISPVLGLVREEQQVNGDKLVLELVYTNVVK